MNRRIAVPVVGVLAVLLIAAVGVGYAVTRGGGGTPTAALGAPHFVDETSTAGIQQVYDGPTSTFAVGGGVAVFDCNGDAKPDIYLAGGSNPAALYRNDSPVGGALKFTRISDPATDLTSVVGAYPVNIDGDGNIDLAVLRVGGAELLRGLGGCRFEPANATWPISDPNGWATSFSAKWEGSAALPTLAVGHYLKLDASGKPTQDCADNALYRPAAGGGYAEPTVLTPGYCSLSMLFSDWDRSGRPDLRIANDRNYYGTVGEDQLWRVAPGQAPRLYTDADGWVPMQVFGMGIASYDVTGDGYPEYYVTSQGDNKLQTLTSGPGQPTYRDLAQKRGVSAARPDFGGDVLPSTAWHPEFQDVNNDGFMDLFVSKGNVDAQPDFAAKDPNCLFLGQPDGAFTDAADAAGVLDYARGRGAALADFNLSGMLSLVEVNYGTGVKIWRNTGAGDASNPAQLGNWLEISPTEPGPNRDAIGAWIEVKVGDTTLRREVTIGGGHAGGQLGPSHFGLGQATQVQVRVQWPDGEIGPWIQVASNQIVGIDRGGTTAHPIANSQSLSGGLAAS